MSRTTMLFAGTDLSTLAGVTVSDWSGLIAPRNRRGSFDPVINRDGALGTVLPLDVYNFPVPIVIDGDTEAEVWANLAAVADLLEGSSGGLGQMERRLDNGTTFDSSFAAGQFTAFNSFSMLNLRNGQTELSFTNLDGGWRDSLGNKLTF